MNDKRKKHARELAYANIRLEGYKFTEELKAVYDRFANNEISQLDAYNLLGIDIDKIPPETREKLGNTFMNDLHKRILKDNKKRHTI